MVNSTFFKLIIDVGKLNTDLLFTLKFDNFLNSNIRFYLFTGFLISWKILPFSELPRMRIIFCSVTVITRKEINVF